jgi:hypothetical protein
MPTFRVDQDRPLEKLINGGISNRHSHSSPIAQFVPSPFSSFCFCIEALDILARSILPNKECQHCIIHKIGKAEVHRAPLSVWFELPSKHRFFSQPLLVILSSSSLCIPERLSDLYWRNKKHESALRAWTCSHGGFTLISSMHLATGPRPLV